MSSAQSDPPDSPPRGAFDLQRFIERVRLLCRREKMFASGQDALVMVSGGQDSLALLHLLASGVLGQDGPSVVGALHVNHHLRGEESIADESLVRRQCETLGVPVEVVRAPIDKDGGNIQARAREARRRAGLQALSGAGNARIALGHTLDDQVETMLYRLGRYAGMAALAPMSPVALPWVRPLLASRRAETAAYCNAKGLEYAVDRGNEYPGYARTGIRERLLPVWEEILPGAAEAAGRSAEVAAEALEIVRSAVEAATEATSLGAVDDHDRLAMLEYSAPRLVRLEAPLRRAVIHSVLGGVLGRGVERSLVLEIEGLLHGTGSDERPIGDGWFAVLDYDTLRFRPESTVVSREDRLDGAGGDGRIALPCPGEVCVGGLVVHAEPSEHFRAHDPHLEAYLDADAIEGDLWVRRTQPGDRMRPLGSSGHRTLQDLFVDLKIPRGVRTRVPVVGCGERILWLAGLVVAEEGRIDTGTTRLLHLSVGPADDRDRDDATGHGATDI